MKHNNKMNTCTHHPAEDVEHYQFHEAACVPPQPPPFCLPSLPWLIYLAGI